VPSTERGAQAFNQQLRQTAAVLAGRAGGGHEYALVCECGCGQTVEFTLHEYDRQGGAWVEGHEATRETKITSDADNALADLYRRIRSVEAAQTVLEVASSVGDEETTARVKALLATLSGLNEAGGTE
jgi:hypothetical protein